MTYTIKVYYSDLGVYNTFKRDMTLIELCRFIYKYHDDFSVDIAVYDDNNKLLNISGGYQGVYIYDDNLIPEYYPAFGHITAVYIAQYDIIVDINLSDIVFTADYVKSTSDNTIECHEYRIERKTNYSGHYTNDFQMIHCVTTAESESFEFTDFLHGMLISYLNNIITSAAAEKDSAEFYTLCSDNRTKNYLYPFEYTAEVYWYDK